MSRVKRGVTAHAKHKKVLKAAKGFFGRRKNTIRAAKAAVDKSMQYAYRDRKNRKREFRALWISAHQCGGARARADLQPLYFRPCHGGDRGRPQGAVRPRHFRAGGVRRYRRAGEGRAAEGGLSRQSPSLLGGGEKGLARRGLPYDIGPCDLSAGSSISMSDLSTLERETLAAIDTARDENALEAARVAALGKKGSISALLATLGKLAPDERKAQGAAINALKDQVTEALTARRAVLKRAALEAQLKRETVDVTLPVPCPAWKPGASTRSAR